MFLLLNIIKNRIYILLKCLHASPYILLHGYTAVFFFSYFLFITASMFTQI